LGRSGGEWVSKIVEKMGVRGVIFFEKGTGGRSFSRIPEHEDKLSQGRENPRRLKGGRKILRKRRAKRRMSRGKDDT